MGVWRGGAPIGIAVQELLDVMGVKSDHIAIRTSSYESIGKQSKEVQVHGLNYVIKKVESEDSLLIVDDVHDSGLSIAEVIKQLQLACADNIPATIKIATPYFKPANIKSATRPDFYLYETDKWLVFPHEIQGLSRQELLQYKPELASIAEPLSTYLPYNN